MVVLAIFTFGRNCFNVFGFVFGRKSARKHQNSNEVNEQLFSTAGQIYSDRHCNMLGENAKKLLFLSNNIHLFNYDH